MHFVHLLRCDCQDVDEQIFQLDIVDNCIEYLGLDVLDRDVADFLQYRQDFFVTFLLLDQLLGSFDLYNHLSRRVDAPIA